MIFLFTGFACVCLSNIGLQGETKINTRSCVWLWAVIYLGCLSNEGIPVTYVDTVVYFHKKKSFNIRHTSSVTKFKGGAKSYNCIKNSLFFKTNL